jgi:fibronectin type 3 domain-containing protein
LRGSGVAPVQHSVSLSWAASTTTGVVGYNVYRGSVSGGPYAQVNSNDPGLTYTDSGVSTGQTYYYVVTAVDSTGTESPYSNQAQAVVPSP